jgi:Tfp pilus assembly protein PilO
MKQNSKRLTTLLIALGLIVVSLVIFFDLIQPEYANILQTKGQIVGEQGLYTTESAAVATAENVISEYQQQQSSGTIAEVLPTDEDVAGTIAQIYGLAQNSGIAIQSLGISSPAIEAQTLSGSASTTLTQPLGSFSLQISAAGTYENFQSFLTGIETNIRIFDVKSVTLTPVGSTGASGGSSEKGAAPATQDFFTYSLTIETYYQTNTATTN